ncbi:MAG: carotenoid biosynthesis protein [Pseudonocardiales bacterium]|nr:MAG: carotenoid biosynthesis protein [Pseudonocardiales bacterium]
MTSAPTRVRRFSSSAPVAWIAAGAGIAGQVAYPLLGGSPRAALTVITVVAFFVAVGVHAGWSLGPAAAARALATIAALSLAVEAVGLHTGVPFGRYSYTGPLGPRIAAVPVVVTLAWTTVAWLALQVGRRLAHSRAGVVGIGAATLTGWDVFLDPQLVADGNWRWSHPHPALPGMAGVPVSNVVGWLVVSVALIALFDRLVADVIIPQAIPATMLAWIYASETLGNVAFFHRGGLAVLGGVALGACVIPYLLSLRSR